MRATSPILALCLLAACGAQVPDSGSGVGFGSPGDQRAQRDALLEGRSVDGVPIAAPTAISSETLGAAPGAPLSAVVAPVPTGANADIAAETAAALAAASPGAPPRAIDNPGISDENDFKAVSQRETIQSDAARLERNRAQYAVIPPTPVPARPTEADPNIVRYALDNSNPKGNRLYSRSGLNLVARAQRACAKYPSPDQAQIAFLQAGGPERDRLGLDPDGDGYACAWDPAPFRRVAN